MFISKYNVMFVKKKKRKKAYILVLKHSIIFNIFLPISFNIILCCGCSKELKLKVCYRKIIFLFFNQNICCGYSKEPLVLKRTVSMRRFF